MSGHRSKRALVIDDDNHIRELLQTLLETAGFAVDLMRDGIDAVDLREHDYAVILLDMKMPIMSGREFVEEYRRAQPSPAPIVVVSAADDAQVRAAEVGASGWIAKPFDPDVLVEKVMRLLPRP